MSALTALTALGLPPAPASMALPRPLDFVLPPELEATEPVEVRTGRRDSVRLLVSRGSELPTHERFTDLPSLLDPGDLLVVNTSRTLPAAVSGVLIVAGSAPRAASMRPVVVHFSTELPTGLWLVEVRTPGEPASRPMADDVTGSRVELEGGGSIDLLARFPGSNRLWISTPHLPGGTTVADHLTAHGRPIRYHYVPRDWPIDAYDTVFATVPGSAEMPSASRPFTTELVTDLVVAGVGVSPVLLHTGVSSAESHEPPFPERFSVPRVTADRVNATRAAGGRVVAVGTTVVRALESAVDDRGVVHPASGWADVVVTPERGVRAVDGLITGWHEPEASHLLMLEAVAGRPALAAAYDAAIAGRYLWHEFGDVHLILRDSTSP
ncbi:MAG: S-adenosylmethionine:tRNA ribosyltransferase-isomerase [Acidimicrobiales bacterium]